MFPFHSIWVGWLLWEKKDWENAAHGRHREKREGGADSERRGTVQGEPEQWEVPDTNKPPYSDMHIVVHTDHNMADPLAKNGRTFAAIVQSEAFSLSPSLSVSSCYSFLSKETKTVLWSISFFTSSPYVKRILPADHHEQWVDKKKDNEREGGGWLFAVIGHLTGHINL